MLNMGNISKQNEEGEVLMIIVTAKEQTRMLQFIKLNV